MYLLVKIADKDKKSAKLISRHYIELVPCRASAPDIHECYWIQLAERDETKPLAEEETKPLAAEEEKTQEGGVKSAERERESSLEPHRRSTRNRIPVSRIQLDWRAKTYDNVSMMGDEDEEDELGLSDRE